MSSRITFEIRLEARRWRELTAAPYKSRRPELEERAGRKQRKREGGEGKKLCPRGASRCPRPSELGAGAGAGRSGVGVHELMAACWAPFFATLSLELGVARRLTY